VSIFFRAIPSYICDPMATVVLEDDTYTRALDAIIKRQFFPELDALRARAALLDAANGTPGPEAQERLEDVLRAAAPVVLDGEELDPSLGVDAFLSRFTSEDNASFQDLFRKHRAEHRQRHRWVFEPHECFKAQLLKMGGPGAVAEFEREEERRRVEAAEARALMPPPPPRTPDAKALAACPRPPAAINHSGTRFTAPHRGGGDLAAALAATKPDGAVWSGFVSDLDVLAQRKLLNEPQRYGLEDVRRLAASPRINGYGFARTPQFSPGASSAAGSPLLTWGAVATPLTLAVDPVEYLSGPVFNIPQRPKRDERAKALADEAGRRMRQEKAAKQPRGWSVSPHPATSLKRSPASTPVALSPVAQALAHRCGKARSPADLFGHAAKRPRTAASTPTTPGHRSTASTPVAPGAQDPADPWHPHPAAPSATPLGPSITDGLLKI
jgi:protein DGCR14